MKFKVLNGSYSEDGKTYGKGEIVDSIYELDIVFGKRKYERLVSSVSKVKETPSCPIDDSEKQPEEPKEQPQTVVKKKTTSKSQPYCNKAFDNDPKETGLNIRRKGSSYFVFDEEDDETPLNKKGLKKAQVQSFIDSQCED